MNRAAEWYRSSTPAPEVRPSGARIVRNWLLAPRPEPDVRGKTMVLYSRRTFPNPTWRGLHSEYHGLFSEFHSVLGALAHAEARGASGVRVDFRSPLYVEPGRGPNWWTYFFEPALMRLPGGSDSAEEVHLTQAVAKYGRYSGFSDIVSGATPYLYPMTYGISRTGLHRLASSYIRIRQEILDEVGRFVAARFATGAYVVGVHYRGTDATHNWRGAFTHYRMQRVPYGVYVDEVRRVIEGRAPGEYQVFVATDEIECLDAMYRAFGDRVVQFEESPRTRANAQAVHLDRGLGVSNYQKGRSALVDALILASVSYLVKGRSNLSDAALVFNPQLPYSFYPDVLLSSIMFR
jgi:hypothetical protein